MPTFFLKKDIPFFKNSRFPVSLEKPKGLETPGLPVHGDNFLWFFISCPLQTQAQMFSTSQASDFSLLGGLTGPRQHLPV